MAVSSIRLRMRNSRSVIRASAWVQWRSAWILRTTDALSVQALLSLHWTKIHERITENLLLLRRHQPSIPMPRNLKGADICNAYRGVLNR